MVICVKEKQNINMRLIKIFLFILFFLSTFQSCNNNLKYSFELEKDFNFYEESVNCLVDKYDYIFDNLESYSKHLRYEDLNKMNLCLELEEFMKKKSFMYVVLYRDSTVSFYTNVYEGIKSKQFVLMSADNIEKIYKNKPSNSIIINDSLDGWYELERVISMAD
jgi:hypothetical protein